MNQSFIETPSARFRAAVERFDAENSRDPNRLKQAGAELPRELVYARWLSDWVVRLKPEASEALRLAARSAHLRRWAIRRDAYPLTRAGYLRWRAELKAFHAKAVGEILQEVGYSEAMVKTVQGLVSKASFPHDPDSRVLEDALCLVFLEHQFGELSEKSTDDKMINALRKTWKKMTETAQAIALSLNYNSKERALLERALGPD